MKYTYIVLVLFTCFLTSCSEKWQVVYTHRFDWNKDGTIYNISMELPKGWNDGGDFTRVKIASKGKPDFVLNNIDGWANNDHLKMENVFAASIIKNKYFLLYPINQNENVLMLIGWGYASQPSKLNIITLYNGCPEVIFSDQMDIYKYQDINNDSIPELILRPWLGERFGPGNMYATYIPLLVYRFSKNNGHWTLLYDESLSIKYTTDNLYGWAGRVYTDSIIIVHPKVGKPKLMKLKDARSIYEH